MAMDRDILTPEQMWFKFCWLIKDSYKEYREKVRKVAPHEQLDCEFLASIDRFVEQEFDTKAEMLGYFKDHVMPKKDCVCYVKKSKTRYFK